MTQAEAAIARTPQANAMGRDVPTYRVQRWLGAANPCTNRRHRASRRARLAQPAASARVGLQKGLAFRARCIEFGDGVAIEL